MPIATASQTITPLTRCQRSASRWPMKDISAGSLATLSLLRRRLKKFFLSDDAVAKSKI